LLSETELPLASNFVALSPLTVVPLTVNVNDEAVPVSPLTVPFTSACAPGVGGFGPGFGPGLGPGFGVGVGAGTPRSSISTRVAVRVSPDSVPFTSTRLPMPRSANVREMPPFTNTVAALVTIVLPAALKVSADVDGGRASTTPFNSASPAP